ncbi:MAG: hypothetical protein ACLRRU_12165 [Faecalibacterium sp.]
MRVCSPRHCPAGQRLRLEVARHEAKRPFRSLIVCVSCAMVGCILASTAYSRRVDELEIERDIYASRFQNWQTRAIDAEENASQLQTEVDNLTAELAAQIDLTLTYAGSFSCTAYCTEEYAHICGEDTELHPAAQRCSRA